LQRAKAAVIEPTETFEFPMEGLRAPVKEAPAEKSDLGKWFANFMLISGAVLISISPTLAITAWVFGLFLGGHILWAVYSLRKGHVDRPMLALNIAYIALDIYAIVIRL
jgi:hypothetical protein